MTKDNKGSWDIMLATEWLHVLVYTWNLNLKRVIFIVGKFYYEKGKHMLSYFFWAAKTDYHTLSGL